MATIRQKLAFKEVVSGSTVKAAMLKAGYAETTANRTNKLTRTDGYRELCEEIGLTDEFITKALYDDIESKPGEREKELRLAFQVKGKLKGDGDPGGGNQITINVFAEEQLKRVAARVLDGSTASEEEPHRLLDSDEPEIRTELAS